VNGWYGWVYPAGVPAAVVTKTHAALSDVLSRPVVRQKLEGIGAMPALSSPQEFGKLIADEVVRWRTVATAAGLQPQ